MTIQKGKAWEQPSQLPTEQVIPVVSETELHEMVARLRPSARHPLHVSLNSKGDLARTIGLHADGSVSGFQVALDYLIVKMGDRSSVAVSHITMETPLHRNCTYVMNAQWRNSDNIGHRAHPNDGKADVITWSQLSWWQWRLVKVRLKMGTFSPHPAISEKQQTQGTITVPRLSKIKIDGNRQRYLRSFEFSVVSDAIICHF